MSSQKVRAQAVAALEKKGRVTANALVAAARNKNHPLHKDFDWNDKTAAHKQRIDKANEIIASIRVVITTSNQRISSVCYVRDPRAHPNVQGKVSVATLRDDVQYAREALDAEVDRVKSCLERAREFASAVDLQVELETALQSVMKLHSRSRRGPAGLRVEERVSA